MFIGKYGVGKTSLMRRLLGLGKHAAINTESTDGVSISKCMINVQNGEWRPCDKTDDDLARLIKHVFAENKDKTKDNVAIKTKSNNTKREMKKDVADHQEIEQTGKSDLIKTPTKNVSSNITLNIDVNVDEESKEDNYEATNQTNQEAAVQDDINSKIDEHSEDQFDVNHTRELQRKELDNIDKEVNDTVSITSNRSTVLNEECNIITVDEELCQTTRKDDLNKMTSDIIDKYVKNSDASQPQKQEELASCWLWDFAGQNDFYATHQAFLSSCAVYILVADSLEFSAKEKLWIDFENSARKYLYDIMFIN
ncbi:Hypothetical predicted protein [Mytilus galloprovincialis]|uniref:Uncharacterized protein n=1 Tax=Mytilus galloprovincialis TaxID=29158 RepID=A0A8B6G2B0_MYTGA|nr:Hypothetical predicted protein [Mytilus galloprovincialis]